MAAIYVLLVVMCVIIIVITKHHRLGMECASKRAGCAAFSAAIQLPDLGARGVEFSVMRLRSCCVESRAFGLT